MKILVIVESPSKCKKIESYLGSDNYKVVASCGHICKLESLKDIDFNTMKINYKISNHKVVRMLRDEISKSSDVLLATDDDREGEAIAWHICKFCNLDITNTKKIVFREITESALKESILRPTTLNLSRVYSQQTRQILDLCIGHMISPLLWKHVKHKIGAGRCLNPALHLIKEQEIKLRDQSNDTIYNVSGYFTSRDIEFKCNKKIQLDQIKLFLNKCIEFPFKINRKPNISVNVKAPKILITSTLQQKASSYLHFSPKQTMSYAQKLYEKGYITYMRTDCCCFSNTFLKQILPCIEEKYSKEYVSSSFWGLSTNKKSKSQEAHEGIRVTDPKRDNINIDDPNCKKLYSFIYKHTYQSCMSDYIGEKTIFYTPSPMESEMIYEEEKSIFMGWKIINNQEQQSKTFVSIVSYLELIKGFTMNRITATEVPCESLHHYGESTLIQILEKKNIGRPSTFANILDSIKEKQYIKKGNIEGIEYERKILTLQDGVIKTIKEKKMMHSEKSKLILLELGDLVDKFCYVYFEPLFNYTFTEEMETKLDKIENNDENWKEVIQFYINEINKHIDSIKDLKPDGTYRPIPPQSLHCGIYNGFPVILKNGKYGYYIEYNNKNTSLNKYDISSSTMDDWIKDQCIDEDSRSGLYSFLERAKSTSDVLDILPGISLRPNKKGPGYYVFIKRKNMKKPTFHKYNDEGDDLCKIREQWVKEENISQIQDYLKKKYNFI